MFLVTLFKPKITENEERPQLKAQVISFASQKLDVAFERLAKNEEDESVFISVMVSANDVRSLKKAYPNYFGSTDRFEKFLSKYIGENS
ncbi:MAG: hypothetical protein ACI9ES_002945 [Oceanospirillaceae bacterium]|jgi:hypothetical protein